MITLLIFLGVAFILVIEAVSLWGNTRQLKVEFDLDTTLVEPGELATLYYTVSNPHRLPILYVGFSLYFDSDVTVCEDKEFCRLHVSIDSTGTSVRHHFFLLPHRKFSGKVHFSLNKRGRTELGRYFIDTGDFLGLYPIIVSDAIYKKIICTAKKCSIDELAFPGGEIGNVSVKRFILDDPTMLLGYRDYTGREPMKQISWKQTAKVGKLMVRQNDHTTDRVAVVLVNMEGSQRLLLESCLKLVRTVCEQLEEAKIPYELMSNGDLFSIPEGIGREHLFLILRRLGLSRLGGVTSFSDLVERCVRRRRSNCSYIVITPIIGPERKAQIDYLGNHLDSRPIVLIPSEA